MSLDQESAMFRHEEGFAPAAISGMLGLGPLEQQYQELFAGVLEDGVITAEERSQLERAASNLGLDRQLLFKLERAMVSAYEAHHQVRIVEEYEQPAATLAPVDLQAEGVASRSVLLARIEWLERRVHELEAELRRAQSAIHLEVDLTELESAADLAREDPLACGAECAPTPSEPRRTVIFTASTPPAAMKMAHGAPPRPWWRSAWPTRNRASGSSGSGCTVCVRLGPASDLAIGSST